MLLVLLVLLVLLLVLVLVLVIVLVLVCMLVLVLSLVQELVQDAGGHLVRRQGLRELGEVDDIRIQDAHLGRRAGGERR